MREVRFRYEDPLDRVWIGCAERIGLRIVRDAGVYASSDGAGTLRIATAEHLDPDDSLAQMIFHELCHSLVEGPQSLHCVDWGLDNESDRDLVREHACLRLQALLCRPLGLGRVLAPTTEHRPYWDALGPDPLAPADDPAAVLARIGAGRVASPPWAPHLEQALRASADIARAAALYGVDAPSSLWSQVEPPRPRHPAGHAPLAAPGSAGASQTCGSCAWATPRGKARRCRKAGRAVRAAWPACERWEPALDCRSCGACCRQAFDTLLVGRREPVVRRHPRLVVARGSDFEMPRPSGRCAALEGDGTPSARYECSIYEDRPRSCRAFAVGSDNCLLARRRVGLSW